MNGTEGREAETPTIAPELLVRWRSLLDEREALEEERSRLERESSENRSRIEEVDGATEAITLEARRAARGHTRPVDDIYMARLREAFAALDEELRLHWSDGPESDSCDFFKEAVDRLVRSVTDEWLLALVAYGEAVEEDDTALGQNDSEDDREEPNAAREGSPE